jgi:hypothetical protein
MKFDSKLVAGSALVTAFLTLLAYPVWQRHQMEQELQEWEGLEQWHQELLDQRRGEFMDQMERKLS